MALDYGAGGTLTVSMDGPYGSAGSSVKAAQITLLADSWKGATSPYSQTVEASGVSNNSQINPQPNAEQIALLGKLGIALMIENDGGTVTAYSVGGKPDEDITMQVTILEVTT